MKYLPLLFSMYSAYTISPTNSECLSEGETISRLYRKVETEAQRGHPARKGAEGGFSAAGSCPAPKASAGSCHTESRHEEVDGLLWPHMAGVVRTQ